MIRALTDAWLGNHQAALATLDQLVERQPYASVYAAMADVYAGMDRDVEAREALERAADANPEETFYAVALGDLQAENGLITEAEATYRSVLAQDENIGPALAALARLKVKHGNTTEALQLLQRANTTAPTLESLDLARNLESTLSRTDKPAEQPKNEDDVQGDVDTSIVSAEGALRHLDQHPQNVVAWQTALEILAAVPHPRAAEIAEDALLLFPGRPELVIPAAEILVENSRKAEAIAAVEPFLGDAGVDMAYRSRAQDIVDSHQQE